MRRLLRLCSQCAAATACGFLLFLLWFASGGPAWERDPVALPVEAGPEFKALERSYARRLTEMRLSVVDPGAAAALAAEKGLTREAAARRLLLSDVATKGLYANVMTDEVLLARVDRQLAWPYAQRFAFLGFATDGGGRGFGVLQPWCVVMPARQGITFGAANHLTALSGGLPFAELPPAVDWSRLLTLHELEHCIEFDERMGGWLSFRAAAEEALLELPMAGESWADAGAALEFVLQGETEVAALLADLRALAFARQVAAGRVVSLKHFTSPVLWQLLDDLAADGLPNLEPLERHLGPVAEDRRRAFLAAVRERGLSQLEESGFETAVLRINLEERRIPLHEVAARLAEAGLASHVAQRIGEAVARYLAEQRCRPARDPQLAECLDRDSEGSLFWRTWPRHESHLAGRDGSL